MGKWRAFVREPLCYVRSIVPNGKITAGKKYPEMTDWQGGVAS